MSEGNHAYPYLPMCYSAGVKHRLWVCQGLSMLTNNIVFHCEKCGRTFFMHRGFVRKLLIKQ